MKSYEHYRSLVPVVERPEKKFQYKAMNQDGQIEIFDYYQKAKNFAGIHHRVVQFELDKEEYEKQYIAYTENENKIFVLWYTDLRKEYSYLNDRTFDIVYEKAYERGHSAGYDEVANYMINTAEFAEKIMEANK